MLANTSVGFLTAGIVSSLFAASASASVTWQHTYDGDVLPQNASPAWTAGNNPNGSVDNGILTIAHDANEYYLQSANWDGNSETGSTIEFRVRQLSGHSRLQIGKTLAFYDLLIGTDRIAAAASVADLDPAGGNGLDIDMTDFRTIRLVMAGGTSDHRQVNVYVDNDTTPAFQLSRNATSANRILIPDGASGDMAGTVEYDYIYWTNAEATPPVPEPTAAAGMGLGALWLLMRRRH